MKANGKTKQISPKTERREARGGKYQQEREGKSNVGAGGRRESSRMGGKECDQKNPAGKKGGAITHPAQWWRDKVNVLQA